MRIASHTATGRQQNAFTMVEVAIALAVIAFALVAIIGVLPTGLTAQKGNREDTIINQDGPYFLEVIRSGGQGIDHLQSRIESMWLITRNTNSEALFTNENFFKNNYAQDVSSNYVGFLSIPRGTPAGGNEAVEMLAARVRAMSGAAVESGQVANEFGFGYQLTVEVVPLRWDIDDAPLITQVIAPDITLPEHRTNFWNALNANVYELRVTCRWPLLPNDRVGPNRKTFRTTVSGRLNRFEYPNGAPLYFFEPQNFVKPPQP